MQEEEKKTLSQEERKFINLAKRFIRQASIAIKNFRMFGENHPVLVNTIQGLEELLKDILTGRDSITFTFLEGTFLVEDTRLKDLDPKAYSLITELAECSVTSLTFLKGVGREEIVFLLKTISSGPASIKDSGGLVHIFQKKNVARIKVDETYFKRVTKKEEEVRQAKDQMADILIIDYLLGKSSFFKGDIEALVKGKGIDPKKMAKIVSRTAVAKNRKDLPSGVSLIESAKGVEGIVNSPAKFARTSIEKLAVSMKGAGKSEAEVKKDVGDLILALEPSLRSEVLKMGTSSQESTAVIKDAMAEFSDKIITDIIISEFIDRKLSIVEARQLIRQLLPNEARRKKIFPSLEKNLIQKGVSQDICSKLFEGKFWVDMIDTEKVKSIEENSPAYCVEIGVAGEIEGLIRDLLNEKKFDLIPAVVNKLFDNLSSDDAAFKVRLLRDFKDTAVSLFESDDYPHKDKLLDRVQEEYRNTKEKEVKERFIKIFASFINICVDNKRYAYLPSLMHTPGYGSVKGEVFSETSLETLLKTLLFDKGVDDEIIKRLLHEIGEDAEQVLCNILISMKIDDFDSYKKRHDIAAMVKSAGKTAETFFIGKLSSGRIEEIKISLEILPQIGTKKSIPSVEKLLSHKDVHIRERAKKTLENIKEKINE